jgi:hypothetical protein
MHHVFSIAVETAVGATTVLIAGLIAYVELTRAQLSIKSR